jgi:hypothetical protein
MASGIDVSARMVSLSVNIALMGFILASGVGAELKEALPNLDAGELRLFAERIAAGNAVSVGDQLPGLTGAVTHAALVRGFGWVMLYGGIGVWIMSAVSFLLFHSPAPRRAGGPLSGQQAE